MFEDTMSEQVAVNPGPCILCGTANYPASMGGPAICPPCDCGVGGHPYPDRYLRRLIGKDGPPDHDERNECGAPTLLGRCTKPKGHVDGPCADLFEAAQLQASRDES